MAFMTPGVSNGQDGARQAAMQYIRPGGPTAAPAGGGAAPAAGVGAILADAYRQTMATIAAARSPQEKEAALAPWKQVLMMMGEQLKQAQQGAGPAMGGAPAPQFEGAQAMSPMIGRPPR